MDEYYVSAGSVMMNVRKALHQHIRRPLGHVPAISTLVSLARSSFSLSSLHERVAMLPSRTVPVTAAVILLHLTAIFALPMNSRKGKGKKLAEEGTGSGQHPSADDDGALGGYGAGYLSQEHPDLDQGGYGMLGYPPPHHGYGGEYGHSHSHFHSFDAGHPFPAHSHGYLPNVVQPSSFGQQTTVTADQTMASPVHVHGAAVDEHDNPRADDVAHPPLSPVKTSRVPEFFKILAEDPNAPLETAIRRYNGYLNEADNELDISITEGQIERLVSVFLDRGVSALLKSTWDIRTRIRRELIAQQREAELDRIDRSRRPHIGLVEAPTGGKQDDYRWNQTYEHYFHRQLQTRELARNPTAPHSPPSHIADHSGMGREAHTVQAPRHLTWAEAEDNQQQPDTGRRSSGHAKWRQRPGLARKDKP